jgi:hypothetical protein
MCKIERWSNISGQYSFDCSFVNGILIDSQDKELPSFISENLKELFPVGDNDDFQVVINFLSEGYYDPGRTYGDPEFCYPPEGEDNRTLDGLIEVHYLQEGQDKYVTKELPQTQSEKWFNHFYEEIEEEELNISMSDCQDYDRYND